MRVEVEDENHDHAGECCCRKVLEVTDSDLLRLLEAEKGNGNRREGGIDIELNGTAEGNDHRNGIENESDHP